MPEAVFAHSNSHPKYPNLSDSKTTAILKYSKDLKKDQNIIHTLMGNDVGLRKDFIVSNAINVSNLDI